MLKVLLGLLVIVNLIFFALMQWGDRLTVERDNPAVKAEFNADQVRLVSEVQSGVVAASAPLAVTALDKTACYEWGDFSTTDLARAEQSLSKVPELKKIYSRQVDHAQGYWVYVAPAKTPELLAQNIALIKSLGINDYYLLRLAGPWQNAISLGVFKTEEPAKIHLAKMQAKGLKIATLGARDSKLNYNVLGFGPVAAEAQDKLKKLQVEFAESTVQEIACVAK